MSHESPYHMSDLVWKVTELREAGEWQPSVLNLRSLSNFVVLRTLGNHDQWLLGLL